MHLRRLATLVALSLPLSLGVPVSAHAAGELDATFAGAGARTYTMGAAEADANSVAVAHDGTLVFTGSAGSGAVGRVLPDGTPDDGFGTDGFVLSDFDGSYWGAGEVAVQADGKVLLAGYRTDRLVVIRLHQDGSLDTGFGTDGIAEAGLAGTQVSFSQDGGELQLQPDGTIVAASRYWLDGTHGFTVAKFTPQGVADTTWSDDGIAFAPLGSTTVDLFSVALDGGRVLAAGRVNRGVGGNDWAVARFSATGAVEAFGGQGFLRQTFALPGQTIPDATAMGVVALSDHRFVVAGSVTRNDGSRGYAIMRYLADGSADASFNSGTPRFVEGGFPTHLALHGPTGRYLVATTDANEQRMAVQRILVDGSLDLGWGVDGAAADALASTGFSYARSLAVQRDGKVVVVGDDVQDGGDHHVALMRLAAEAPAPPTPPTPVVPTIVDTDGDGIADATDCAPFNGSLPLQASGVVDANCNGVDDAVEAAIKAQEEIARKAIAVMVNNLKRGAAAAERSVPKAVPAAGLLSRTGVPIKVSVPRPQVVIPQVSGMMLPRGSNVVAAGSGNVIAAGSANVVAAGSANLINVARVVAAGGGNLAPRARRPRARAVLLFTGGHTFRTAGSARIRLKPTAAGRRVLVAYRAKAAKLRRRGRRVPPLRLRYTTITGPLKVGSAPAVARTRFITITP